MTRVKICGLTRGEDVDLACELGASHVGFVFAAASPRRVGLERARDLSRAVRPGVVRVGVCVDEDYAFIEEAVDAAGLDLVQIHRPLRTEDLDRIRRPIVAVARMSNEACDWVPADLLERCGAILFDGAGQERSQTSPWDWSLLIGVNSPIAVFLAGGLDPGNVSDAIGFVRPAVVDVASGVECEPGRKDTEKMRRFFEAVAQADDHAAKKAIDEGREAHAGPS